MKGHALFNYLDPIAKVWGYKEEVNFHENLRQKIMKFDVKKNLERRGNKKWQESS